MWWNSCLNCMYVHLKHTQSGIPVCCTQWACVVCTGSPCQSQVYLHVHTLAYRHTNTYESLCTSVDMGQVSTHTCQHWYLAGRGGLYADLSSNRCVGTVGQCVHAVTSVLHESMHMQTHGSRVQGLMHTHQPMWAHGGPEAIHACSTPV